MKDVLSAEECSVADLERRKAMKDIMSVQECCVPDLEQLLRDIVSGRQFEDSVWESINAHITFMNNRLGYEIDPSVAILNWLHQNSFGSQIRILSQKQYLTLTNAAFTDAMTGLYNHRFFRDKLDSEFRKIIDTGESVSLILIDLDNLKIFNDTFGHQVVDTILNNVSQAILSCLRKWDFPCRYGGDEIAVILPQTARPDAVDIAERIRHQIENAPYAVPATHSNLPPLTASIGVSAAPSEAKTPTELVGYADIALYKAKKGGKNKVIAFTFREKGGEVLSKI